MKTIYLTKGQDLFQSTWTEGNLYRIQWITSTLGDAAGWVISVVGFGIVIFSILKNALSGLYVINPVFWDKVDDVKSQVVTGVGGTVTELASKNAVTQKLGGIFTFFLGLVPNFKALTDFDDGAPVDKKQYFMKSIPLMVAQIFIGILIFYGYPAKLADWVGSAGTYAISAVIDNVDPVEVVTNISGKFVVYNLSTDGSVDKLEQTINKMAKEMTATVSTKYSDMKKQPIQETALALEGELLSAMTDNSVMNVLGAEDGYSVNISASAQSTTPKISANYSQLGNTGVYSAQAPNGTFSFKYWVQGTTLPTGSTMVSANDYFVWTVQASPIAVNNTTSASLVVFGGISESGTSTTKTVSYPIKGITIGNNKGSDIKGVLGQDMAVEFLDAASGDIVKTYYAVLESASVAQSSGAVPILTFSANDRADINQLIKQGCVLRINLTGSWSYDILDNTNSSNTLTLKVNEIRVSHKGGNTMTGALTTWGDVDANGPASVGLPITMDMVKQQSMSGKTE